MTKIFAVDTNKFAIGTIGKLAKYVVKVSKGGKITGVRGRRPKLDARFKTTKANAAIRTALTEAVAG